MARKSKKNVALINKESIKALKLRPSRQVFLNVPFDNHYRKNLLALICSLVCAGRQPRCAQEVRPTSNGRMEKITELIENCIYSISDLSRMSGGPKKLPRFNMPFELGIIYALHYKEPKKYQWFLLESKRHRLGKTLSDLDADPKIHYNNPKKIIRIVLEWCELISPYYTLPIPQEVIRVYNVLSGSIPDLKRMYEGYPRFEVLVGAASAIAKGQRLVPPGKVKIP